jgi:hypothetical protein
MEYCALNLQELLRSGTILLLFHQTIHEERLSKHGKQTARYMNAYFKKSEKSGLQAEGSAKVGGGCFGTRNKTFMGWLRDNEMSKNTGQKQRNGQHFEAMRGGSSSAISIALRMLNEK